MDEQIGAIYKEIFCDARAGLNNSPLTDIAKRFESEAFDWISEYEGLDTGTRYYRNFGNEARGELFAKMFSGKVTASEDCKWILESKSEIATISHAIKDGYAKYTNQAKEGIVYSAVYRYVFETISDYVKIKKSLKLKVMQQTK